MKQTNTRKVVLSLNIPIEIKGSVDRDDVRTFIESFINQCVITRSTAGTIRYMTSTDLYSAAMTDGDVSYAVSNFDKKD